MGGVDGVEAITAAIETIVRIREGINFVVSRREVRQRTEEIGHNLEDLVMGIAVTERRIGIREQEAPAPSTHSTREGRLRRDGADSLLPTDCRTIIRGQDGMFQIIRMTVQNATGGGSFEVCLYDYRAGTCTPARLTGWNYIQMV